MMLVIIFFLSYCTEKLTNSKFKKRIANQFFHNERKVYKHKAICSITTEDKVDYKFATLRKVVVSTDQCPLVQRIYKITVKQISDHINLLH